MLNKSVIFDSFISFSFCLFSAPFPVSLTSFIALITPRRFSQKVPIVLYSGGRANYQT